MSLTEELLCSSSCVSSFNVSSVSSIILMANEESI